MRWLGRQAQSSAATPPTTPATHSRSSRHPTASSSRVPPSSSPAREISSSPMPPELSQAWASSRAGSNYSLIASGCHASSASAIPVDSGDERPSTMSKRKRPTNLDAADSDSDCVVVTVQPKRRKKRGNTDRENMCEITKQFRVSEIRDIFEIPSLGWTAPRRDAGEDFAYRLDLTADSREWTDTKKELLSMAAIVKLEVCASVPSD